MSESAPEPEFDVIVWGASGYVGRLICEYLASHYSDPKSLRWAMGGRSQSKLETLRNELGSGAENVPVLTGDAADPDALEAIVQRTKVVLTTVGPYAKYGSLLVATCARMGVDYVDLAGEVPWIQRMIDRHQKDAEESGARIVPCCGFDSVPSDLGVYFLNAQVRKKTNAPCTKVKMRVKAIKGGASGGTVARMLNLMEEAQRDPSIRKIARDPYALVPASVPGSRAENPARRPRQPSDTPIEYDQDAHAWIAPFLMAGINTRVVHRTNALLGYSYGEDFRYSEAMMTGKGLAGCVGSYALAAGLGGFVAAASVSPLRSLLSRFVLPSPGEGPSRSLRKKGFYNLVFLGETEDGQKFAARVTGDQDLGYGSTAKIISECAICLAQDITREQTGGGFWTPASAMGDALLARLTAHAGLSFEIEPLSNRY